MATQHRRHFPRVIAQFRQLEGGQYGTLDLVAITDDVLELQLGADFVQFNRDEAEDLCDAVQAFLELEEGEGRNAARRETMAVERETIVEERDLEVRESAATSSPATVAQPPQGQQPGRRKHHHRHP